jgi:hypothetical protein
MCGVSEGDVAAVEAQVDHLERELASAVASQVEHQWRLSQQRVYE